jgi:hypothetical protein
MRAQIAGSINGANTFTAAFLRPQCAYAGHMLGAAQTVKLPADHVIVDAQQQVFDVINNGDISFGVFEANRCSLHDVLAA